MRGERNFPKKMRLVHETKKLHFPAHHCHTRMLTLDAHAPEGFTVVMKSTKVQTLGAYCMSCSSPAYYVNARARKLATPLVVAVTRGAVSSRYNTIGPNCPGISGTVTDFRGPSRIPDSFIIVPEVEERRAIKPLVAQMLASLGVDGGIIRLAACPKRFCDKQFTR